MAQPSPEFSPHRHRRGENAVRAGPGVLICPRCGVPLRGSDHDLGIAWRCEACGGQSLNFSQFRRMVPEHGANDIWLEAATRPRSPRERTQCPECQAEMDAVLIPFRGRHIELDICRSCQRLWLDRQELESSEGSLAIIPRTTEVPGLLRSSSRNKPSRAEAEMMMGQLERANDRHEERNERQRHALALIWAAAAGILTFLCLGRMPAGFSFRIAWVAAVVVYALRMLWR